MKTGKEIKFNKFKDYKILFGSVNNKNPKAIYINISAWAEPLNEEGVNYNRAIKNLHKDLKQTLFNQFNSKDNLDFVKEKTIVDLDIRESGIKFGKRSFMNCEITLFLETEIPVNSERMKYNLDLLTPLIITGVFQKDKTFKFHKKKI